MLNGVISEPGYGSEKQGKERVFVTTDELPSISGTIGSRNGNNGGIFERPATGVFSYQEPQKGLTYALQNSGGDWFTYTTAKLSFGKNTPHNNIQPAVAAFAWKRTA